MMWLQGVCVGMLTVFAFVHYVEPRRFIVKPYEISPGEETDSYMAFHLIVSQKAKNRQAVFNELTKIITETPEGKITLERMQAAANKAWVEK